MPRTRFRPTLRAGLVLIFGLLPLAMAAGAAAQERPGTQLPAGVTEAQVLDRLRQSGMSREDARARLGQMGYDPALADPYYDRLEGRTSQPVGVDDEFVRALQAMGMVSTSPPRMALPDSFALQPQSGVADSLAEAPDTVLRIFGRSVFTGRTSQFQPVLLGPVDAGYRLGPGDELFLVLTGDVELAYTLDVTREGYVVIPDVGQMSVNGLTLEGLRNMLFDRLDGVYSGVRRTRATTFFDVSLGRLRTNQVFVIGDAVRPGAYQVSAVSTVFNALHLAGGPSDLGSFRSVAVRRGGRVVAEVDLYDYLILGDASRDVRLEQGDIVFVPPAGAQVAVQGKVRRPAIYEIREGEGVREALAFAGGLGADAALQRVQIDRVLPPSARIPGTDRVLLDVDLAALADPRGELIPLRDGDDVRVFATLPERRNRVVLTGSVYRPGLYEYRRGMTIWELIGRADGLSERAFRPVAHVIRPVLETGGRRLLQVSLETDAQGRPVGDLELADRDSVVVYAADSLATRSFVQVEGFVKNPGRFPYAEGATVRDLIVAAGGFQEGAQTFEAEVVRLRQGQDRSDTLAFRQAVVLDGDLPASWAPAADGIPSDLPSAGDFHIKAGDRVFVRLMPGYVTPQTVSVQGEVLNEGPYALQLRNERLSNVIERAGRATRDAYVPGARLQRDSVLVGIDLEEALRRPGGPEDVVLEDGDVIVIPRFDPTVLVQGEVAFESKVLYRRGRGLKGYLRQAGGTREEADLDRVSVLYPNGQRAAVKRTLWVRNYPEVQPGSTIFVPRASESPGTDWGTVITTSLSVLTALATVLLAVNSIP